MRLMSLTCLLCLCPLLGFSSNSAPELEESFRLKETLSEISISDLEYLRSYLKGNSNRPYSTDQQDILSIISTILSKKDVGQSIPIKTSASTHQEEQAFAYRQEKLKNLLRSIFHKNIYTDDGGSLTLSNRVPIIYDKKTDHFSLKKFSYPHLNSSFKDNSSLKVYEESLKYPNYNNLKWDNELKEYSIYVSELERFLKINEILKLSNDHLIITFISLFPIANQKPVWAWRIFGTTSIKKAIINLLKAEKNSYLN